MTQIDSEPEPLAPTYEPQLWFRIGFDLYTVAERLGVTGRWENAIDRLVLTNRRPGISATIQPLLTSLGIPAVSDVVPAVQRCHYTDVIGSTYWVMVPTGPGWAIPFLVVDAFCTKFFPLFREELDVVKFFYKMNERDPNAPFNNIINHVQIGEPYVLVSRRDGTLITARSGGKSIERAVPF